MVMASSYGRPRRADVLNALRGAVMGTEGDNSQIKIVPIKTLKELKQTKYSSDAFPWGSDAPLHLSCKDILNGQSR